MADKTPKIPKHPFTPTPGDRARCEVCGKTYAAHRGFWGKLGNAVGELFGNLLYQGPR